MSKINQKDEKSIENIRLIRLIDDEMKTDFLKSDYLNFFLN
jgi:hypothetical protein